MIAALTPDSDAYSTITAAVPALLSRCTLVQYLPWDSQSLTSVAAARLDSLSAFTGMMSQMCLRVNAYSLSETFEAKLPLV